NFDSHLGVNVIDYTDCQALVNTAGSHVAPRRWCHMILDKKALRAQGLSVVSCTCNKAAARSKDGSKRRDFYTPITFTNSATASADFLRAACSSGVSLMLMICSRPLAPSLHGTPTNRSLMPYSPWR